MKKVISFIGWFLYQFKRVYSFCVRRYLTSRFSVVGNKVYVGNGGIFSYKNIEIGDDVYIGANACFQVTFGKIIIGNHVMFGPGVNIHGGNHKFNEIGRLMKDATPKQWGDDGVITIEDDCWIGANAIILSNVTIGKGSVVGAGSVVTKSLPPYSVYTGVPSAKVRSRFTEEEIEQHEKILGGGVTTVT